MNSKDSTPRPRLLTLAWILALALAPTLLLGINPPLPQPSNSLGAPGGGDCPPGSSKKKNKNKCKKKSGNSDGCATSFSYSFNLGQSRIISQDDFLTLSRSGLGETQGNQAGYRNFDKLRNLTFSNDPLSTKTEWLVISKNQISSELYNPFVLRYFPNKNVSYIAEKGTVRQVLTDDSFTLIEPIVVPEEDSGEGIISDRHLGFRIKLWPRSALASTNKVDGAYLPPSSPPIVEDYFRNPDFPEENNRLLFTKTDLRHPENPLVTTTLYDQSTPDLLISNNYLGGDLSGTLLSRTTLNYLSRGPGPKDRTYELTTEEATLLADGSLGPLEVTSKVRKKFVDFSRGEKTDQRLIEQIIDPGTDYEQATTWEYFQDANNSNIHGRLKSVRRPDGSWERWEYADQGQAVVIEKRYSSWNDITFENYQLGRLQETIINASEVTRTTLIEGTVVSLVVSRTQTTPEGLRLLTEDAQVDGQPQSTTISAYHSASADALLANRPAYRISPDGSLTTWEYQTLPASGLRITTREGFGDLSTLTPTTGTLTISDYDSRQNILHQETRDLATNLLLSKRTGSEPDEQGEPTKWTHDDDPTRYTITLTGPHGVLYQRELDGSTITYAHDELGRIKSIDRQASPNAPVLRESFARSAETTTNRISDGETSLLVSSVTTVFGQGGSCCGGGSSSSLTTTQTADADGDGQPETSTQLVLLDPSAGKIIQSTSPDGSTRNSTHYLDGRIKSQSGTAQTDQTFDYGTHQLNGGGLWTQVTQANGTQWVRTYFDALERPIRTEFANGSFSSQTYYPADAPAGSRGKLHTTTDPDGLTLTYLYDDKGQATTSTSLPDNRTLLTRTDSDVVDHPQLGTAHRIRNYRNDQLLSTTLATPDRTQSQTDFLGNISTQTSPHPQDGASTRTQVAPNGVISHSLINRKRGQQLCFMQAQNLDFHRDFENRKRGPMTKRAQKTITRGSILQVQVFMI